MAVEAANGQSIVLGDRFTYTTYNSLLAAETEVNIYGDLPLLKGITDYLLIDGLAVQFDDADAAGGTTVHPWIFPGPPLSYIKPEWFTTTATQQAFNWNFENGVLVMLRQRSTAAALVTIQFTACALLDRLYVAVWGRIPKQTDLGPLVQPVSVEGYKWPLTRR